MISVKKLKRSKKHIGISVIIPTFNGSATIGDCVKSIQNQTIIPAEIIIIDNASTDETRNEVKKLIFGADRFGRSKSIKLIENKKNLGVTGGRNVGIKTANKSSDYLFFFDHDMVATENMLEELLNVAETDSGIGILTPKIYYWEDKKRVWAAGTNINLWTGRVLFRGGRDIGQFEKAEEVQVAPAAIFVKKEVVSHISGFDEKYFATYEDTDFCFRAKLAGFRTVYVPKAVAYHKISPDKNEEARRLLSRAYWVARNKIIFMRDHGRNFYIFLLVSCVYCLYFVQLAFQERDLLGLINYVKGYFAGIVSVFLPKNKTYLY